MATERYKMRIEDVPGGYLLTRTVDGSSSSIKMPLTKNDAECILKFLHKSLVEGSASEATMHGTVKKG